ncbi:MAG: DUF3006 domain-containing protein [Oscillospiraceae bacterium]
MKQKVLLDRIEDGVAVLEREDGTRCHLPAFLLPAGAKEQDWLWEEDCVFTPAPAETVRRREKNADLFDSLFDRR